MVISIISLLSSIIVGQTKGAREKGENAEILLQVKEYEKALYLILDTDGEFPSPRFLVGALPTTFPDAGVCLGSAPQPDPNSGCGAYDLPLAKPEASLGQKSFVDKLEVYIPGTPNPNQSLVPYPSAPPFSNRVRLGARYVCDYTASDKCTGHRLEWPVFGTGATTPVAGSISGITYCLNLGSPPISRLCTRRL